MSTSREGRIPGRVERWRRLRDDARRLVLVLVTERGRLDAERRRSAEVLGVMSAEVEALDRLIEQIDAKVARSRHAIAHWSQEIAREIKRPIIVRRRQAERKPESEYLFGRSQFRPSDQVDCSLAIQSPPWWILTHGRYGIGAYVPFSEMWITPTLADERDWAHIGLGAVVMGEKYGYKSRKDH